MSNKDIQKKINAAYQLCMQPTISRETLDSVRTLVNGMNPQLDTQLMICAKTLNDIENFHKGDIATLTIENLPEDTEEQKKKKRALLFLLQSWKDLQNEISRVKEELQNQNQPVEDSVTKYGKIIKYAKGPFGLITAAAVLIVVGTPFLFSQQAPVNGKEVKSAETTAADNIISVITYQDKQIPLTQLHIGQGPECDTSPHYHAINKVNVTALDGTVITDPGACGYGKVSETKILQSNK